MNRRRLRIALVLPFLLLLAEQGAWLHELSHTYYSGRALHARVSQDDGLVDNSLCLTCQAFAQVANPVSGAPPPLDVPRATFLRSPDPAYHILGAEAPTPRSRGPPLARA